jgi:endonuclease-8
MPEGDTIWRTARALDDALAGRALVRFEAPRLVFRPFVDGTVIEGAEAVGKHCLVHFDDGRTLRTHMRMTGSWHLYQPGERWQKAPSGMRALVGVDDRVAVCFLAPVVEMTARDAVAVEHLGPDLCLPDPDIDEALRRMAAEPPDRAVGDVLLDQRVAAGIGNIWRAESCFACALDPTTPIGAVDEPLRRRLLETVSGQLRDSIEGRRHPAFVYGRRGHPCRRCGTTIRWAALGEQRRGAYWCPTCQAG